jgi:hypothetical protein
MLAYLSRESMLSSLGSLEGERAANGYKVGPLIKDEKWSDRWSTDTLRFSAPGSTESHGTLIDRPGLFYF